jgi:hypothetical protein
VVDKTFLVDKEYIQPVLIYQHTILLDIYHKRLDLDLFEQSQVDIE